MHWEYLTFTVMTLASLRAMFPFEHGEYDVYLPFDTSGLPLQEL